MSSLLELSLNSCLTSWRFLFVNPESSCRIKWPDAETLIAILRNLKGKFGAKDLKGMCLCMMDADTTVMPLAWLKFIVEMKDECQSQDYYDLLKKICGRITERKTLEEWRKELGHIDVTMLSYMRDVVIPESDVLGSFLTDSLSNDLAIELICHYDLKSCVQPLLAVLISSISKINHDEKNAKLIFDKLRMCVRQFPEVAEALYNMNTGYYQTRMKAALSEIASPNGDENAVKYHQYLMDTPMLCIRAMKEGIKINIDKNNKGLCDSIFRERYFTSDMIKVAFEQFPERTLDSLSSVFEDVQTSAWVQVKNGIFVLKGVLNPIEEFSQDNFSVIVDRYWKQIKEDLWPNQGSKVIKTLDGQVTMTKDPKMLIEEHLEKLFKKPDAEDEMPDDWRFSVMIRKIYEAYEKAQAQNRSKVLRNLIEYLKLFAEVNVENLTYSGIPTSRTIITLFNINVDLLSRIHPKVVLNTLNSISTETYINWDVLENSPMEYYANISENLYEMLNEYKDTLSRFGLFLENVAVRRATEKYQELSKMLNRQVNKKGSSDIQDSKWIEILRAEEAKIGVNKYRLSLTAQSLEVLDNLYSLKTETQTRHINNITYIYTGSDIKWHCDSFLKYSSVRPNVSSLGFKNFKSMLEKCGFSHYVHENNWIVTGIYNGYNYIPISVHISETFLDDVPEIPLNQKYSKDLIQHLTKLVTNPKLSTPIKGSLSIALMRARTVRSDGTLDLSVVGKLESLVKGTTDIKVFKEELKNVLPEYSAS